MNQLNDDVGKYLYGINYVIYVEEINNNPYALRMVLEYESQPT